MNNSNRRLGIILSFAFVAAVILAGILSQIGHGGSSNPAQQLGRVIPLPDMFETAAAYGTDAIVLSNSRSFVEYNYNSGASTLLSADSTVNGLIGVDSISTSADTAHLVFHANINNVTGGPLEQKLQQLGLDIKSDYWWAYDISSQSFSPLPSDTVLAHYNDNTLQTLSSQAGQEYITSFDTNLQQTAKTPVRASSSFTALDKKLFLQTSQNQILMTEDGIVNQVLLSNSELVGVAANKQNIIAVQTVNNVRSLINYSPASDISTTLATQVTGDPSITTDGTVLYATQTANNKSIMLHSLDTATSVDKSYGLPSGISNASSLKLETALNSTTAIISDGNKDYLAGTTATHILKSVTTDYASTFTDSTGQHPITYDTSNDVLDVSALSTNMAADKTQVYNILTKDGYDPLLTPIVFTQSDAVDSDD